MTRCVAILGGSFDPIHNGHIALAVYFVEHLKPDELRIIPAGNPWQKEMKLASAEHRIEMLRLAFAPLPFSVTIDRQEIDRQGATYTIDTLKQLRSELGSQTSMAFLLGADQLQQLDTWKDWPELFHYAHLCVATRPGYPIDRTTLPPDVAQAFAMRTAGLAQIRTTPCGYAFIGSGLAVDVSATDIRPKLQRGEKPVAQVPAVVLDYIEQFHLYKD
ncbi:MAG: nicotinate-nucleotide adenylyltransferase [Oxalobacter sp.]|nr:MAG: nicotinate-nucleotide adenylyltransferase [Oxalobacter sp.]